MKPDEAVKLQRRYYRETAADYDALHLEADPEHEVALAFLLGIIDRFSVRSILDLGAGTGRVLIRLCDRYPGLQALGLEPVEELRRAAYGKGLREDMLVDGDANHVRFPDASFDVVSAFGLLHHVPNPDQVVSEMLRVSRIGIFISDSNNFGQGAHPVRAAKQLLNALSLWPLANWIKTRGRGYSITEGDGISFSYSVFNNYDQIKARCQRVYLLDTRGNAVNLYRDASHVALFGAK